jgi:hypothetical protein
MNKLEEKRLSNDPIEKEKYEASSRVPKAYRWWETKTEKGYKLAQKDSVVKTAQNFDDDEAGEEELASELVIDRPRFEDVPLDEDDPYGVGPRIEDVSPEEFQITTSPEDALKEPQPMAIRKNKKIKAPDGSNSYYVAFDYDKGDYMGDIDRVKRDGLANIILAQPDLENVITEEDISVDEGQEDDLEGTVFIRYTESLSLGGSFAEVGYDERDVGGTLTATGIVVTEEDVTPKNKGRIINDALNFIRSKHKDLDVKLDSLDLSNLEEKGEIQFMAGVPQSISPVVEASSKEFPIVIAGEEIKKK